MSIIIGKDSTRTRKAQVHQENQWSQKNSYYEAYFAMRRAQVRLLTEMIGLLRSIWVEEIYTEKFRALLLYTAETFDEANDGEDLLLRIEELYQDYRQNRCLEIARSLKIARNCFNFAVV